MTLTLKEAIQSRKLKLIAKELESLARQDRSVKKIVDQLKKGKEPKADEITSLKGDTQDEVVMAFASVIGPSKTSDFLGEEKGPCWDGYKQVGTKKKNGKEVPNCVPEGKEDPDIGDREGSQPASYHKGLAKSTKEKRDAQFKKQSKMSDDDPDAYKPAPGDKRAETKPSKYTKKYDKMFGEHVQEIEESNVKKSLQKKSEETGVAYGILKQVYDRGVAAWRTGHRPGTTPTQWGLARVNSFVTGGKTQKTTDKDLWAKHKGKNEEFELDEAVRVDDQRYVRSNKSKPKGRGRWLFTTKPMGTPKDTEVFSMPGVADYKQAMKKAQDWAKKKGSSVVYVMESVELKSPEQNSKLNKEEVNTMSHYLYSEEKHSPMHVAKAIRVAKDMGGNMTGAVEKIEKMAKGFSDHPKVKDALRMANEEFVAEKAESQAQAIAARIALKHKREGTQPEKGSASAEMMKMSEKDLEDFTKAKKGAPEKVAENIEDKMPASPDEKRMAMKQSEFIQYVGREIGEHLAANKEFPEWMQNKLSALHQKAKDMHATLGDHGGDMKEEVELHENFIRNLRQVAQRLGLRDIAWNLLQMEKDKAAEKIKQSDIDGFVKDAEEAYPMIKKNYQRYYKSLINKLKKAKGREALDMMEEIAHYISKIKSNKKMRAEEVELNESHFGEVKEAKMDDSEVLAAAKKLASNGKDEKAKSFGKGLVDFYEKNKSFTPDQVAGLQNIMKNASFQMAEAMDPVDKEALKKKFAKRKDKDIDNDGDVDSSDEYLHKRRSTIAKAIAKEQSEVKLKEKDVDMDGDADDLDKSLKQRKQKVLDTD